jgi:hypothetical protein
VKSPTGRSKPPMRERMADHERPRAVLKGPPIAVKCTCGERRGVEYGEVWDCTCGRSWNTAQIKSDDYARLRRLQLRFRAVPIGLGLATSALALYFLLTGNSFSLFFLLPFALVLWGMMVRPVLRRRYARALGVLPQWNLYSEPSAGNDAPGMDPRPEGKVVRH